MAIISRTATVAENASATSVTATLPTDRQAGDLCVVIFALTCTVAQFTGPGGGWTQLVAPTDNGVGETIAAYWQFTPGSAPTATSSGAASRVAAICQSYAGVDSSTPIDVAASTTTTSGVTSVNAPSVTTVTPGALLLSMAMGDTSSATRVWVTPSGMSNLTQGTGGGRSLGLADELRPTAGATGTRNWTHSPSATLNFAAAQTALRPSPNPRVVDASDAAVRRAEDVRTRRGGRVVQVRSAVASTTNNVLLAETFAVTAAATRGTSGDATVSATVSVSASATVRQVAASTPLTHTLEVEFTPGVWTDLTSRIAYRTAPVRIRQGRPTPYDEIGGALLTCALFNGDGALMPDNPASAFAPNVVTGKRIRWRVAKIGVTYTRFIGWIQAIKPEFPDDTTNNATVSITAIDALGLLSLKKLRSNFTETALWRARLDAVAVDAYEASGSPAGSIALMTNYSTDAGRGAPDAFYLSTDETLSFGSDNDVSIGGAVTASGNQTCKTVAGFQSNPLQIFAHVKGPSSQVSATLAAQAHVCLALYAGASVLANLGVRQNGASNGIWLRGSSFTELGIIGNIPFGQWVRVVAVSRLANPARSDWQIILQDGTISNLNDQAIDIRTATHMRIPGHATPSLAGSFGGIVAIGSRTSIDIEDSFVAGSRSIVARLGHMANTLANLPIGIVADGAWGWNVATGQWAGRTAAEVLQEQLRTGGGIAWAHPSATTLYLIDGTLVYRNTVTATIDLDGDCIGAPSLDSGVELKPTRIEVEWAGGVAVAIDAAGEAAGQQRSKRITTVAPNLSVAQARAQALLSRALASRGTRIGRVTLSLGTAETDHIAELFGESNWDAGLYPTARIRTPVPLSHFGVPTLDHHVEGWVETYGLEDATVTMDTTPAVPVTLATETFTAANGSAWPGQWTTTLGAGYAGGTIDIQSNRGRLLPAAGGGAGRRLGVGTWRDVEITGLLQVQGTAEAQVWWRQDAGWTTGYALAFSVAGGVRVQQLSGGISTRYTLTGPTYGTGVYGMDAYGDPAVVAGTDYRYRIRHMGEYLSIRVWDAAISEPGVWQLNVVDSLFMAAGYVALYQWYPLQTALFDDLTITTGA